MRCEAWTAVPSPGARVARLRATTHPSRAEEADKVAREHGLKVAAPAFGVSHKAIKSLLWRRGSGVGVNDGRPAP
jgi:hypothetical protein